MLLNSPLEQYFSWPTCTTVQQQDVPRYTGQDVLSRYKLWRKTCRSQEINCPKGAARAANL